MILNQKLKVTNDLDNQIDNLNAENKILREDHAEQIEKMRSDHDKDIEDLIAANKKA